MNVTDRLVTPAAAVRLRPSAHVMEAAIAAALFALALAMRLVNLSAYSGLFDEGIRLEQLFLMSQGYRPFRDIFAAQGPLLLDLLYPLFRLYGGTLEAARFAVATYSLVGLAGVYWTARQLSGPAGGLAAAALLVLSPLYLEGSRLALAEVTALGFAAPAVGAAVVYLRNGDRRWLAGAAVLLAVSLLVKPITAAALVPLGLAVLLRGGRGVRDAAIIGPVVAVAMLAVVVALGLPGVLDQIVDYRLESRDSEGWSLAKNQRALSRALSFEPAGLYALAAFGGVLIALRWGWRSAVPIGWAVAGLALLLAYSPLHGKHAVVAIPALATLGGCAVGLAVQRIVSAPHGLGGLLTKVALLVALAWYTLGTPSVLAQSGQLLRVTADTDVDPAFEQYADAVAAIKDLTQPTDFVVTDHPYLAFLAERRVPPQLVDTAKARIRSRSLTANEAVELAAAADPRLVVLWSDRLRPLRPFKSWVEEHYRLVKVYNRRADLDRGIYLRASDDLVSARAILARGIRQPAQITFGEEIVLLGYTVDRTSLRRGEGTAVTLHWEAVRRPSLDHHVVTYLRDRAGRQWDAQEESLSGGSVPTTEWEAGRWLFQGSFVRVDTAIPPGEYLVTVGLYDSRARRLAPPTVPPGLLHEALPSGEIILATVRVE